MAIATCAVSGNVKDILGQNVQGCIIRASVPTPFYHSGGPSFISGELASVTTDNSGDFTITLIETETQGQRITVTFDYFDGTSGRKKHVYSVVIPNQATAEFADLLNLIPTGNGVPASVTVGGTGWSSLTPYGVLLGNGQSPIAFASPTTADYPLCSNGASSNPTFKLLNLASAVTGVLPVVNGGTGAPFTISRAMVSNGSGLLAVSSTTATELGYVNGVTSALQAQLNAKQASLGYTPVNKAGDTMSGPLYNDYISVADGTVFMTNDQETVETGDTPGFFGDSDVIPNGASMSIGTTDTSDGHRSAGIQIFTGDQTDVPPASGGTGPINIFTGSDSGHGGTGAIYLSTGTPNTGLRGSIYLSGTSVDMQSTPLVNLVDPTDDQDAATKAYVDASSGGGGAVLADGSVPLTADWNTGGFTITATLNGVANLATTADSVDAEDDTTTNATMYPAWFTGSGGYLPPKVSTTKMTFNPSTGLLTSTGHAISGQTATTVPYLDASKKLTSSAVTPTELGYVSGVTSAVQTQLTAKAPLASPIFTGTVTTPLSTAGPVITNSSGVLSSEAQLAGTRGGTGVNSTATYPTSGVIVTEAASETLTNKTIAAGSNTLSGITNSHLSGSAAITNANLATVATATFKGRTTAGTGAPEDLTVTQATALLNAMVGDSGSGGTKGLVPAAGSGDAAAGKFLKADGTFAVPPGSGGTSEALVSAWTALGFF